MAVMGAQDFKMFTVSLSCLAHHHHHTDGSVMHPIVIFGPLEITVPDPLSTEMEAVQE